MYYHKNGLYLCKIESADLETLHVLKSESWYGTHQISIINKDDQKRWFESTKAIVLKAYAEEHWVGIFKIDGINYNNRVCDVGWDILAAHRGKGFGKMLVQAGVDFCFEILNLNRLNAEILENNHASQKCAEAASFVKEGNKRKSVHKCGEYIDSYMYGILSDEWVASRNTRFGVGSVCNHSYQPKNSKASESA